MLKLTLKGYYIDFIITMLSITIYLLYSENYSSYFIFIYFSIRLLFASVDFSFYLILFLTPLIALFYIGYIPILNILILLAFIILIFKKKKIRKNKLLLLTCTIISYEILHVYNYGYYEIFQLLSWITPLLYLAIYVSQENSYNHKVATKYFILGIVLSSFYGVFEWILSGRDFNVSSFNTSELGRFGGGFEDPNYFSLFALIGIILLFNGFTTKKQNKFKINIIADVVNIITILALLYLCFISLSRMFFILLFIYISLMVFKFLTINKEANSLRIKIVLLIGIGYLIVYFIQYDFKLLWELLISRFDFSSNIQFSNRDVLVQKAYEYLLSNPFALIFGVGVQSYGVRIGTNSYVHNFLLEVIVSLGVVGGFIYFVYLRQLFIMTKEKLKIRLKENKHDYTTLLIFSFGLLFLNAIEVESFYFFIVFIFYEVNRKGVE